VAAQPVSLREELAVDEPPLGFPIEDLAPESGNVVIVGAAKTGKSTLAINLSMAYATGQPFLGSLHVEPGPGRLATINYEVGERQWRSWMRKPGLSPDQADRLSTLHLRGYSLPLQTQPGRDLMVQALVERAASWAWLDPYQRAANVADFNDHGLAVEVLNALDEVKARVGLSQLFLVAHTPWSDQERPAGARVLENWADVLWIYTGDAAGNRYLRAYGRDVDFDETPLHFDPQTLTLQLADGGSRADAARVAKAQREREAEDLMTLILRRHADGLSKADLEAHLKDAGRMGTSRARAAIRRMVDSGRITVSRQGPAQVHRLTNHPHNPREVP
jgi:hypothetical protein